MGETLVERCNETNTCTGCVGARVRNPCGALQRDQRGWLRLICRESYLMFIFVYIEQRRGTMNKIAFAFSLISRSFKANLYQAKANAKANIFSLIFVAAQCKH